MTKSGTAIIRNAFRNATVGCVTGMGTCVFLRLTVGPNPNLTPYIWLLAVLGIISAGFHYLLRGSE